MSAAALVVHLALMLPVLGKLKTESLTWLTACFWHQLLLLGDRKKKRGGGNISGSQQVTAIDRLCLEGDQLPGT